MTNVQQASASTPGQALRRPGSVGMTTHRAPNTTAKARRARSGAKGKSSEAQHPGAFAFNLRNLRNLCSQSKRTKITQISQIRSRQTHHCPVSFALFAPSRSDSFGANPSNRSGAAQSLPRRGGCRIALVVSHWSSGVCTSRRGHRRLIGDRNSCQLEEDEVAEEYRRERNRD